MLKDNRTLGPLSSLLSETLLLLGLRFLLLEASVPGGSSTPNSTSKRSRMGVALKSRRKTEDRDTREPASGGGSEPAWRALC